MISMFIKSWRYEYFMFWRFKYLWISPWRIRTLWCRYPLDGLLQKKLATGDRIIEEGLCGRTTVFSDELREGRRGLDTIGILLESHAPVDLLILMLGANDCKTRYNASAGTIAKGLEQVIAKLRKVLPTLLSLLVIYRSSLLPVVGDPRFDPELALPSVRYVRLHWR